VDTQGLLMHAIVHAADIQDRDGGALLMATFNDGERSRLKRRKWRASLESGPSVSRESLPAAAAYNGLGHQARFGEVRTTALACWARGDWSLRRIAIGWSGVSGQEQQRMGCGFRVKGTGADVARSSRLQRYHPVAWKIRSRRTPRVEDKGRARQRDCQ